MPVISMIGKSIAVFFTSAIPCMGNQIAVTLAKILHMPKLLSGVLSATGSYTPVPFLLYSKHGEQIEAAAGKKSFPEFIKKYMDRYGCLALLVLIALPFTGLGCFFGAVLARIMHLDKNRSAVCIFIENVIAVLIITGCLSGIVAVIQNISACL